jgi:hypothetical protein
MTPTFLLHIDQARWRVVIRKEQGIQVAAVSSEQGATLVDRAGVLQQILQDHGYAQEPIILALPSCDCLSACISTESLDRVGRRRAMAFRLEEQLPISAEEFVADYVPLGRDRVLGVCTPLADLTAILEQLQRIGVQVHHVLPFSFLACMHVAAEDAGVDGILLLSGTDSEGPVQYDLVELRDGAPSRWLWLAEDEDALREELQAWARTGESPKRLAVIGEAESSSSTGSNVTGVEPVPVQLSADATAVQSAEEILKDSCSPWIDLRRDSLAPPDRLDVYRKPLGALVAALIVLMVCISVIMQWRGRRYQALAEASRREQAAIYKTTMNTTRVPAGVLHRLRSERRHLAGVGGKSLDGIDMQAALPTSALLHLQRILAGLPTDRRFRILDLSIQPDLIRIDGQARSHVEAEKLVVSLREGGEYEVAPPKTQALKDRDGKGVSVLFTAKPIAGAPR